MNHDAPRQKKNADGTPGLWHYTRHNDRTGTYAIGPCAEGCAGHATEEEACEHYRQHLISNVVIRGPKTVSSWPKNKCEIDGCECEGTMLADIPGGQCWELCPAHATQEHIAPLVRVGESWHS